MRVVPAPGLTIRDPRTKRLIDADGVEVGPHDLDFIRMLANGDVVEKPAPKPAAAPPPAPPAPQPPVEPKPETRPAAEAVKADAAKGD